MDYKYIEQLMERYFDCETSLQEEQILRSFFQQDNIPAELLPYRDLFRYQEEQIMTKELGDDFDAKILSIVEKPTVKAKRISFKSRLNPFLQAAATVAIILTIGNAIQHSFYDEDNYDFQQVGTVQPEMGYHKPASPLEMTAEEIVPVLVEENTIDSLATLTKPNTGF